MRNYLQDIVRSIMSSAAALNASLAKVSGTDPDTTSPRAHLNPNFRMQRSGGSHAKRRAKWRARTGQK